MEHHEFPLATLFRELRDEVTTLVRQEFSLAKAELSENLKRALRDVALIAAGGALAFCAFIFLLLTFRNILVVAFIHAGADPETALWLSPFIVALVVGIAAWALIAKGKKMLSHEDMSLRKTATTLRQDKAMIQQKLAPS